MALAFGEPSGLAVRLPIVYFGTLGVPRLLAALYLHRTEPPGADPHVRWVWQGVTPPVPIGKTSGVAAWHGEKALPGQALPVVQGSFGCCAQMTVINNAALTMTGIVWPDVASALPF